ncbi:hypothetical protein PGR6_29900 [Pseudomonas sp. GR 6-02]|nr:hypothetical protein PGR6_29900 [Pseudomonas sp. GR 6-02]
MAVRMRWPGKPERNQSSRPQSRAWSEGGAGINGSSEPCRCPLRQLTGRLI